jgi:SAM-dependent methyltransferase
MHVYNHDFYETADRTAAASADGLIRHLAEALPIRSVLDIGCGRGVWLAQWLRRGATTVVGVDGPYIDGSRLAIPQPSFVARDLAATFSLDRQFDLVQSLEVAEHVSESCADIFVDNVVRHGKLVLFSAAVPGQGGEHHVNEQPWEYWRRKFAARGYEVFDHLRPRVRSDDSIYFCYRFNSFVFAHQSIVETLPAAIRAAHVPAGEPLRNEVSLWLQFRFAAVRSLPQSLVDRLARVKYRASGLIGLKH